MSDLDKFKSIVKTVEEIVWWKPVEKPVEKPVDIDYEVYAEERVRKEVFNQKELDRRRAKIERRKARNIK